MHCWSFSKHYKHPVWQGKQAFKAMLTPVPAGHVHTLFGVGGTAYGFWPPTQVRQIESELHVEQSEGQALQLPDEVKYRPGKQILQLVLLKQTAHPYKPPMQIVCIWHIKILRIKITVLQSIDYDLLFKLTSIYFRTRMVYNYKSI